MSKTLTLLKERRTIKRYLTNRDISTEQVDDLIDIARFEPSSYGSTPYRLLVFKRDSKFRKGLFETMKQIPLEQASVIFIWVALKNEHINDYVKSTIQENVNQQKYPKTVDTESLIEQTFGGFQVTMQWNEMPDLGKWAQKQAYISLGGVIVGAAEMGIDVVPMEGFNRKALDEFLTEANVIDPMRESAAVALALGYKDETDPRVKTPTKVRLPLEKFVEIVD